MVSDILYVTVFRMVSSMLAESETEPQEEAEPETEPQEEAELETEPQEEAEPETESEEDGEGKVITVKINDGVGMEQR